MRTKWKDDKKQAAGTEFRLGVTNETKNHRDLSLRLLDLILSRAYTRAITP